jgi:2'-5' RNA ligase
MEPNWFIALPLADDRWFERTSEAPPGVRLLHPEDLHATVAFLGPVGEARARRAMDALSIPLSPLRVTLGAVVPMGNPRRFSALSALLDHGRDAVESAMAASRDRAWRAAAAERDDRPPKAHVTIARPTRDADESARRGALAWAASLRLGGVELTIDRVALYTWSDTRHVRGAREFRAVIERALPSS